MFSFNTKLSILRAILTKKAPYYVQFYINGRCNLKCKQCNIVETNSGIGELTVEQVRVVAQNLKKINGGIVLLTGGEPFLRRDLHLVAKELLDVGLDVRLQTAGLATDQQLQQCYDVGCRDINISLDSLDPNKQDYINSVPGTWHKAIDAIERVSRIFHGDSAICSFGCVLSRLNYREIPKILEFATKIGWHLSLVPVHIAKKGERFGFRSYETDLAFKPEDIPDLIKTIERLIEMKRKGYLLFDAESYLWSAVEFAKGLPPTWRRFNNGICDSPNLYFAIRPNGDFTTCCDYVLNKPPNLSDPDFHKLYHDGTVHKAALPIVKNCGGCHYGSYPEVTLSIRDKKAFWQRVKLTLLGLSEPMMKLEDGEGEKLAESLRDSAPDIYGSDSWLPPEVAKKLETWRDPKGRRELVEVDNQKRIEEGRIRKRNLVKEEIRSGKEQD